MVTNAVSHSQLRIPSLFQARCSAHFPSTFLSKATEPDATHDEDMPLVLFKEVKKMPQSSIAWTKIDEKSARAWKEARTRAQKE